jgi:enoyl-CoA hydratase/carnithine racemase
MSEYARFRHIKVEVDEGIALVVFAPVVDNDLYDSFYVELRDIWVPLAHDRSVRAVALRSSQTDFGTWPIKPNIEMLVRSSLQDRAERLLAVQQVATQMLTFPKPVVAILEGPAHGLGAQIAFFADAAVATPNVVFGDGHVPQGMPAGDGGTMLWPMLVGVVKARKIAAQGAVLTAAEAHAAGLIDDVVEPQAALTAGLAAARRLAALPRLPFVASKLAINNWLRFSALISWDLAAAYQAAELGNPSLLEGFTEDDPSSAASAFAAQA